MRPEGGDGDVLKEVAVKVMEVEVVEVDAVESRGQVCVLRCVSGSPPSPLTPPPPTSSRGDRLNILVTYLSKGGCGGGGGGGWRWYCFLSLFYSFVVYPFLQVFVSFPVSTLCASFLLAFLPSIFHFFLSCS